MVAVSQGGAVTRGRQDKNAFGPGATSSAVARQAEGANLPWVSIETGKSVSVTVRVDLQQSQLKAEDIRYRANDALVVEATGSNPAANVSV